MPLTLKKSYFSRNKDRQKEFGEFFSKTSSGLNFIMGLILTIFFTPAIVATSFLSKEIVLILVNLTLALGYLSTFAYRCYKGEVSKLDMSISLFILSGCITLAYLLCPPLGTISFLSGLIFTNQMAIATNLFFVFKNVLVPPCMKLIKNIGERMGYKIADRYFNKPHLNLDKDRHVIDRLLKEIYGHDSFSEKYQPEQLRLLNNLLDKLCEYINKYDEPMLGYVENKDNIMKLEKLVESLTTEGNIDSCYTFIQQKIDFKTTKIGLLSQARDELMSAKNDSAVSVPSKSFRFFQGLKTSEVNKPTEKLIDQGIQCIDTEIMRQTTKLESLTLCKL